MTDVLLSEDNNGVRLLTLNRPDSFNALTVELKERLLEALRHSNDRAWRAVEVALKMAWQHHVASGGHAG